MKILEFMSFNPGWFLTPPGILITAGVILLLIALILLLSSGKKEEAVEESVAEPTTVANIEQPVVATEPVQVTVPQMPEVNLQQPPVEPAAEFTSQSSPSIVTEPVQPSVIENIPTAEQSVVPQITPEVTEKPKIEIFEPKVENPVDMPVSNVIPTVEDAKVEEPVITPDVKPAVSIYGGVSPTVDLFKSQEGVKPIIYGGADPLENTAPIPKVDVTPVMPNVSEVTQIIEPTLNQVPVTQTAVMDNSVTDTIPATPVVPEVPQTSALFETPVAPSVVPESVASDVATSNSEEIETLDF